MVIVAWAKIQIGMICFFNISQTFAIQQDYGFCNFNLSLRKPTNNRKIHGETEQAPPCDFHNRGGFENT
jgi:hypothetical protein